MSTWANGSSSMLLVGGVQATATRRVLAVDCRRELLHVATEEVVELVVLASARVGTSPSA